MPLSTNNIESELSYAYLHAVASRAGLNCKVENRHGDNYAVDAVVDFFDHIPGTYRTDVSLRIQLKATKNRGTETDTHIAYFYRGVNQYDKMRTQLGEPHRILIVLHLPENDTEWLGCCEDELVLKQAAYWVCLYGADAAVGDTGKTIYLPKANLVTPDALRELFIEFGLNRLPVYVAP